VEHGLNLWIGYPPLAIQAELGEKPTGQHAVVGPSAHASERGAGAGGQKPEEIRGRETRVEAEVDLVLTARLAMREADMLFGVADHKLDLVAQPVAGHNLLGWLRQVGGGEHQAVTGGGFAEHHHPQVASTVRAVGQSGPDLDIRAIREATDLLK